MFLGIDLGTSGVKAVLTGDDGAVIAQGHGPLSVARPHALWSEQDPEDWWQATQHAVMSLPETLRSGVRGIGLSGQMHGATLLDDAGRPLRPAILWNDGRSSQECDELERLVPDLPHLTGNRAMPGFTAPKLLWVRRHEPSIFKATCKILLPKDYLRLMMVGVAASDMSDSAGTLWLNTAQRQWSGEVLEATDLTPSHMPTLFEGPDITGTLRPTIADAWGMPNVPVVAGAGDNAAGAIGSGVTAPGDGFLSLGTSGVIFRVTDSYQPNPSGGVHTFCHALPDLWHQMAVVLSAASAVDYVANLTGYASPAALFADVEARATLSQGELFLPYLSGERTPHNNPHACGAFFGLTHNSAPAALAQAALEGVAFALADGIQALTETGAPIERLSVIGGGSRSPWWGKILASALNCTLNYRSDAAVGPALGAARLAQLTVNGADIHDVCYAPSIETSIRPDPEMSAALAARYQAFQSLYTSTKHLLTPT